MTGSEHVRPIIAYLPLACRATPVRASPIAWWRSSTPNTFPNENDALMVAPPSAQGLVPDHRLRIDPRHHELRPVLTTGVSVSRPVLPALGEPPLGSLRRTDVEAFLASLPLAPSSVSTVRQHPGRSDGGILGTDQHLGTSSG